MGRLTTHVLDTAAGRPAEGIEVTLHRFGDDGSRELVARGRTNADGRLDAPMLEGEGFRRGVYELVFQAGAYHRRRGVATDPVPFLDEVPIRFGIVHEDQHYHVPLLLAPYGYTTYRGS